VKGIQELKNLVIPEGTAPILLAHPDFCAFFAVIRSAKVTVYHANAVPQDVEMFLWAKK